MLFGRRMWAYKSNQSKEKIITGCQFRHPVPLCFQKSNVFVSCGSADVADSCQFADIQLLALVGGIVAEEGGGDVFFAHLRTSSFLWLLPPFA